MSADSQELKDWSKELGTHLIVELYGARNLFLPDPSIPILRQAAIDCGAEILDDMFHDFGDRYGFTGVIILSESHISIHTWPEHDYAAIDIFLCGGLDPEKALPALQAYFKPERIVKKSIARGINPKLKS